MMRLTTGRTRLGIVLLSGLVLVTANFAISPEVSAKPRPDRGNGYTNSQGGNKKNRENSPPTLIGSPEGTVLENSFYDFVPSASDPDGDALTFTISNKPGWADFDPTTGALYGTPTAADVGSYSSIKIAVSDGRSSDELTGFTIEVISAGMASVTLGWQPPTANTDGTPLTDLAGYRIYYGTSAADLGNVIDLTNPGVTSYVVENLTADTWYFAATALNSLGQESDLSDRVIHDTR